MSNIVQLFNFKGLEIRSIVVENGDVWFVGKDVANLLQYEDTVSAIRQHCRRAKPLNLLHSGLTPDSSLSPKLLMIQEPDVYRLVLRSQKPEAMEFEDWLMSEVLPQLRKTGQYQTNKRPEFPTLPHPVLQFMVVGRQEDTLMKGTRNTFTLVLDVLRFRAAIYKQTLTNNVSRILIGMPIAPFRRLHGIPVGSRRRTRLFYDSDLRRTFDKVEDLACRQLTQQRPRTFEQVEDIVYHVARSVKIIVELEGIILTDNVPQDLIEELSAVA